MKRKLKHCEVIHDEGGQALTEFAIVIPIILLFFFAMLQYFEDFQASQLGNYAAFVAARVYAVDNSVDASGSAAEALNAAAIALGPIARPEPGEIGGSTSVGTGIGSVLNIFMGNAPGNYVGGYLMARYVRLNSSILGGSVTVTNEGSPSQVDCSINYPQPVFIPGLSGLWNLITGDQIYKSMKPLRQGLTGIPKDVLPIYEGIDSAQSFQSTLAQYDPGAASSLSSLVSSIPTIMLPYINIQSKCSLDYENWQKYNGGPRLHATGSESDSSSQETNSAVTGEQAQIQKDQTDQQNYQNAVAPAKQACQNLCTADSNLATAHSKDDPIINDPKASASAKASAQSDLSSAETAQQQASSANASAQSTLNSAASAVQTDTGQSVPGVSCGCN